MIARALVSTLCLVLASAAHAGNTGAGTTGTAASAVGSIVTPGSNEQLGTLPRDDRSRRVVPGNGGRIVLSGDQLKQTLELLRKFEGASQEGLTVKAPTVLADGTPATIAINSRTGELTDVRRER